ADRAAQRAASPARGRGHRARRRVPARRHGKEHHRHRPDRRRRQHGMTLGRQAAAAGTIRAAATRTAESRRAWLRALELTAPVAPRESIAAAELVEPLTNALGTGREMPTVWVHGEGHEELARLDRQLERYSGEAPELTDRRAPTLDDWALYIYTSGTTGLPKAARVSHFRLMQWSHWFAGLIDVQPSDRMYDCLPMYHSVGGVVAPGAALVRGASVVVRDRFSARDFWRDVVHWDCTLVQYIGELCRYLLHAEPTTFETEHRVRV